MVTEDVVQLEELHNEPKKVLNLVKHVDVRWSSMYGMLSRFYQLKESIKLYVQKVLRSSDKEAKAKLEDINLVG